MNCPPATGKSAMVSTPHPLATKAALDILRQGGNAIEAAIAANAALGVLMPEQCGIGGDLFAIIYDPAAVENPVIGLNGSGRISRKVSIESLRRRNISYMPVQGALTVNIPGVVEAWGSLYQKWGRLKWSRLFQPAILLAKEGFQVNAQLGQTIENCRDMLRRIPAAANIYLPDGQPIQPGHILRQPQLGEAIQLISVEGDGAFYQGEIAQYIENTIKEGGGFLDREDLSKHHSEWVDPISTYYRNHQVYALPPTSPGLLLLATLQELEAYDLKQWGFQSPDYIYACVQAYQKIHGNGHLLIADPHFQGTSLEAAFSNLILKDERTPPQAINLKGDTVALCVVDHSGLGISLIQSIFHDFGSGVYVDSGGFFLQNRGASFSLNTTHPNSLEPGKRPAHTLAPTLVCKDNELFILLGTRGGAGQPQTLTQILTSIIDFGFDVQQAVSAKRWVYGSPTSARHYEGLVLDSSFSDSTLNSLEARGLTVKKIEEMYSVNWMGCAQAILYDNTQQHFLGAADPRGGGLAEGF